MSERDYGTPFEEEMSYKSQVEHYHIIQYLFGYLEKPVDFIRGSIQSANYEIQKIDSAISLLGLCWFGEKRKEKRRLQIEKSKYKEYISILYTILNLPAKPDYKKTTALVEKYLVITKFKFK